MRITLAGITSANYGRVTGRLVGYTLQDEDTVKLYATDTLR